MIGTASLLFYGFFRWSCLAVKWTYWKNRRRQCHPFVHIDLLHQFLGFQSTIELWIILVTCVSGKEPRVSWSKSSENDGCSIYLMRSCDGAGSMMVTREESATITAALSSFTPTAASFASWSAILFPRRLLWPGIHCSLWELLEEFKLCLTISSKDVPPA